MTNNFNRYTVNYSPELAKLLDKINDMYLKEMSLLEKDYPELAYEIKKRIEEFMYGENKC